MVKQKCCVQNCEAKGAHRFPSDDKRRELWEKAIRQHHLKVTKETRLCSSHFKPDDFRPEGFHTGLEQSRHNLKSNAVPSLFEWDTPTKAVKQKRMDVKDTFDDPTPLLHDMECEQDKSGDNASDPPLLEAGLIADREDLSQELSTWECDTVEETVTSEGLTVSNEELPRWIVSDNSSTVSDPTPTETVKQKRIDVQDTFDDPTPLLHDMECEQDNSGDNASHPSLLGGDPIADREDSSQELYIWECDTVEETVTSEDLTVSNEKLPRWIVSDNSSTVSDPTPSERKTVSIGTQKHCGLFTIEQFVDDNKSIQFYTGLESYNKFMLIFHTLCPEVHELQYHRGQVQNISAENQLFLVLMKLKRNYVDFELHSLFGICENTVSNIFCTFIDFMHLKWSMLDMWPSKELIQFYMPRDFKKLYPSTRVITDATEIPIVKLQNPIAQQATWSSYKNKNTLKVLVGATPGGLISYCSAAYGGSTSDRQIVERGDLIEKCDPGDSIMADRGFNVQDFFAPKKVTVNIPTFLKGKSQLPGLTVLKDRKLSSKRVHIERLIGLNKTYLILASTLHPCYIPIASKIYAICVMLCNFREGIISKDA